MKRFYIEKELGTDTELDGMEHNHLANVLRCRSDEQIILICGDEYNYLYEIIKITKSSTFLKFIKKEKNQLNPSSRFIVVLALIKYEPLSFAVQKLNEVGVTAVHLLNSANCNIPPKSVNIQKLNIIAQQSCKQCGRSIPLRVYPVFTVNEMIEKFQNNGTLFLADEGEKKILISSVSVSENKQTTVIIGPEGGFTDAERETIAKIATPVSLGRRILRAETAAITASSILLSKLGEL